MVLHNWAVGRTKVLPTSTFISPQTFFSSGVKLVAFLYSLSNLAALCNQNTVWLLLGQKIIVYTAFREVVRAKKACL